MTCIEKPISKTERERRERLRKFYLNDVEMLWNLLIEHSVFTEIVDDKQMVMRNWALKHLEDIGILDEAKLKKLLVSVLNMEVVDADQSEYAPDPYAIDDRL